MLAYSAPVLRSSPATDGDEAASAAKAGQLAPGSAGARLRAGGPRPATGLALCLVALAACLAPRGPALAATAVADDSYRAAENLLGAGRWLEAAELYGGFVERFPDDPRASEARFRRGEALFRAGRLDGALAAFAFDDASGDLRARFRAANTLYLLGRPAEAAEAFGALLEQKRRRLAAAALEGPARYFLARSLLAQGKPHEARAVLEAFRGKAGTSAAHVRLALGDIEAAQLREEIEALGRAGGGAALPEGLKNRLEEALSTYRDALDMVKEGRLVPETLFRIGELLRWSGRGEEALSQYRRAAEALPSGPVAPSARLGAAWAALQTGDVAVALKEASAAANLARTAGLPDAQSGLNLTDEIAYVKGTAELAAADYEAASDSLAPLLNRKTPGLPRDRLLHKLAWSAIFAPRPDLAARSASALLEMGPPAARAAEAHLVLAERELLRGRPAAALEHFESAARSRGGEPAGAALTAYGRAKALAALGKPSEAAAAFDEFSGISKRRALTAAAKVLAARAYLAAGEAGLAAERFKEARSAHAGTPLEAEIVWGASLAEYMRGDFEAMAAFDREIVERFPDSARAAEAAYWFAWSRLQKKEFAAAAEAFADAARRAKGRSDLAAAAALERASALERAGDGEGALAAALELLTGGLAAHAPLEAVLWTAEALRLKGQPDRAAEILDETLARAGEARSRVLYARAELVRAAGDVDEAIKLYDEVIAGVSLSARQAGGQRAAGRSASGAQAGRRPDRTASPGEELAAASRLGKARCLAAKGRLAEAEVLLENALDRTTGWGRAAAYCELGKLRLERAAASEGERRTGLATRAAEDFMFVVLLYEPEGPGEGAELCARALLGAARAYVMLGRHTSARDRLEQLITHPLYGTMPQAREARKLFQQIPVEALGTKD